MCGPAMAILGGVMGAMGSIVQGQGQQAQYEAQAESLKAQAAFNKRQADAETLKGSTEIAQQKRNVERIKGAQTARYSSMGIVSDEGSPVETALSTEAEAAMDRQAIRFGRDLTATNYQYKAQIDEMNAKQAKIAGQYAMTASLFSAGTALIGGFQNAFPSGGFQTA